MGLREPGAHRVPGLDDAALVAAVPRVEVAWTHTLVDTGAATPERATTVERAAAGFVPDLPPTEVGAAGNPVLPLVTALRRAEPDDVARVVHRGLTSLAVTATSQTADLVAGLDVDAAVMRRRAQDVAGQLLGERDGPADGACGDRASYLGAADVFVDAVLTRRKGTHG